MAEVSRRRDFKTKKRNGKATGWKSSLLKQESTEKKGKGGGNVNTYTAGISWCSEL